MASQGLMLSTVGVLITTVVTGLLIYYLSEWTRLDIGLTLLMSMLLAATVSSTDSASVFNLLRTQRIGLKHQLRPLLEMESGSNDPMAYVLTVALVDMIVTAGEFSGMTLATKIIGQLAVGGLLGYMGGRALVWIVNRINLPNPSLYPILVLCSILIIFTFTDMFQGNGYLAVYVAGLVAGNSRLSYRRETNTFMQGITWLLQIVMFLTLGLLVNPKEMLNVWPVAVAIGLFMMFVSRPLAVFLCLLPYRDIPRKAKLFLSWVGLRGAVPIIFATYPVIAGIEDADFLFNVVFVKLESQLSELTLTEESLAGGNRLQDMHFPKGTLVMMVKRGNSFIVPNGQLELRLGDILLTIAQQSMMGTPAKQ